MRRAPIALLAVAVFGCTLLDSHEASVRVAWRVPLPEAEAGWIGVPAAAAGLFIVQTGPALRAFDARSGRTVWRTVLRTGVDIGAENVAVANGRAFVAGGDSVYAVTAATGARLWAFLPDAQGALCTIAADEDAVYVGTRSHRVYALSARTGAVLWSVDVGPDWPFFGIVHGIALSGDTVYVNAQQYLNEGGYLRTGHVFALNRASGAELWHFRGPDDHNDATHAPAISGRMLLVSSVHATPTAPGSFFALDRFTGQELWRISTTGLGPVQPPLVQRGIAYVGAGDTRVYAADLASGIVRWSRPTGGSVMALALCGRRLLINNLELRVLDQDDGRDVQSLLAGDDQDFPTSAFAVSGNHVFVMGFAAAYGIDCS